MPGLEPIKPYECTFEDCKASFNTLKEMIRHKKNSEVHDYCPKCDLDFNSVDELAQHKAWRPDKHGQACRICGDEFKTASGLRRHIEMNHRSNQKIICIGCSEDFFNATLYIDHLEFGHCSVIRPAQFTGHILHKHIIFELLKGGEALDRFLQKVSKNIPLSDDEDGGVSVDEEVMCALNDSDQARQVSFQAMKPENAEDTAAAFENMSLSSESTLAANAGHDTAKPAGSERSVKAWGGKSSKKLFPHAQPTPPPSDFSIGFPERQVERTHGINIMKTRFWDPTSNDWNAEQFFDPLSKSYSCPFNCEQTFTREDVLAEHITEEHRLHRINCPRCLKYYASVTALMRHIETPGSKCPINKAVDFSLYLDRITGGFLTVEEVTRPEFLHNPPAKVTNPETGKKEDYTPPTAKMLKYHATTPPDWKDPRPVAAQFGGAPGDTFSYKGKTSRW